jgi:hypothetical protein
MKVHCHGFAARLANRIEPMKDDLAIGPPSASFEQALAGVFGGLRSRPVELPRAALDAAAKGVDRGDVRSTGAPMDDGGERLSTAPSANELNGHAPQAWEAQALHWWMQMEQRQQWGALAQRTQAVGETLPSGSDHYAAPIPDCAAPTESAGATPNPISIGTQTRDMQAASVLDWNRFANQRPQSTLSRGDSVIEGRALI